MKSAQQYFDDTVAHLRSMESRSVDAEGNCRYLTVDGDKCAVGCHIPEDHESGADLLTYSSTVMTLIEDYPVLKAYAVPEDLPGFNQGSGSWFARSLQFIHDKVRNWDDDGFNAVGESELRRLAASLGLVYTPPESSDVERVSQ